MIHIFLFFFFTYNFCVESYDVLFLQAMLNGDNQDIEFITNTAHGWTFQDLKRILGAKQVKGICYIYSDINDCYYADELFEPFVDVLKRFPVITATHLSKLLRQLLTKKIEQREKYSAGLQEIPWMSHELCSLRPLLYYFTQQKKREKQYPKLIDEQPDMRTSI